MQVFIYFLSIHPSNHQSFIYLPSIYVEISTVNFDIIVNFYIGLKMYGELWKFEFEEIYKKFLI